MPEIIDSVTCQEARRAAKLIRDRFGFDEIEEWIDKVDYDNDGEVDFNEFIVLMVKTMHKNEKA